MVDALRQVRRMVKPSGLVVDIHPTAAAAVILVGENRAGIVGADAALARHQAADNALASALREGLFQREAAAEFDFHTYADSIEELRDFILANWRDSAIADASIQRARRLQGSGKGPCARERVAMIRLRPI